MRSRFRLVAVVLAAVLSAATALAQEPRVELEGVPKTLTLPLAPGANVILTARVLGAKGRRAWIATDRDAPGRFALAKVGEGRFQANLADPVATALLTATPGAGRFRVFVECGSGTVVESLPVAYMVDWSRSTAALAARLVYEGGAVEVVPIGAEEREQVTETVLFGEFGEAGVGARWKVEKRGTWIDPDRLARIEVAVRGHPEVAGLSAKAGSEVFPLAVPDRGGDALLRITASIREAWRKAGVLRVHVGLRNGERRTLELRARPARLELEGRLAELLVYQRTRAELPGSRGYLTLEIGDVTAGQVVTQLADAEGRVLVPKTSLREGDWVRFELGGRRYTLYLKRLVNFLIGRDYAVFQVTALEPEAVSGIDRLLERLAASELTFVRNGKDYTAEQAARYLRLKLRAKGPAIHDVEEFISKIATRSETTGKPYLVRWPDGKTRPLGDWLRETAKEPAEGKAGKEGKEEKEGGQEEAERAGKTVG